MHAPNRVISLRTPSFPTRRLDRSTMVNFTGLKNLGLRNLCTLCDSWENFESFKKIFTGLTGDVARIADNDLWLEDRVSKSFHYLLFSLRSKRFRGATREERGFRRFARAKNGSRAK